MLERETLQSLFDEALASTEADFSLDDALQERLKAISDAACKQTNKSVLAVTVTLLLKKVVSPDQDIRLHQANMEGGFSGRGLDARVVTPFLRDESFPHMQSGSGWLTRSFEQPVAYGLQYPGRIMPRSVKDFFLNLLHRIEAEEASARLCLLFLLRRLAEWRQENADLKLAKPRGRRISEIVALVEGHWKSGVSGASKLPVLATYAAYICLVSEVSRYSDKSLMPLRSHTAADTKTGHVGDVEVRETLDDRAFEAVEVKHDIKITGALIAGCREKIAAAGIRTFYLLSTNEDIIS